MAEAGRERADKRIPVLIAAVLCSLAWAVGTVTREPWPFPIFPGFGTVPTEEAAAKPDVRRVFVIHGDGEPARLELGEMFPGAPNSFYQPMTESFESLDINEVDPELEQWINDRASELPSWSSRCVESAELVEVTDDDRPVGGPLQRIEFPSCR